MRDIDTTDKIIINQAKPLYVAQKCPVCNGWGTVSFKRITCHACDGKGFVLIQAERNREKDYDKRLR